jgi:hypothetical protein
MHHGDDTLAYLKRGFRVVAIEANPSHIDYRVSRNGCSRTRLLGTYFAPHLQNQVPRPETDLIMINVAVTPRGGGTVVLCRAGANSVSSHVLREKGTCDRPIKVLSVSCGELILRHGQPWFVKIDVEGMENACIESILALPTSLLPETIAFESPLRVPTPNRPACTEACIHAFVHIVEAMNARGYLSWKRQWWRSQGQPGMLPDEVRDKGSGGLETWVNAEEVKATACGFFNVSQYTSLKKRWISHISESTGCDLHARLGPRTTSAESSSGARAPVTTIASQLLHPRCSGVPLERCHTTLNSTYASQYEWNRLCHGGVVTVVTK